MPKFGEMYDPPTGWYGTNAPGDINPTGYGDFWSGTILETPHSSSSNSNSSSEDTYISNYLSGLLSSVGAENEANRKYNSAEAQLNRDFNAREAEKARLFSADEAEKNRLFNAAEAEKNREYQTLMSNTAYTRAMSDMKNAGLNPILMMSKGFSTNNPSGSMAQGSSAASFSASGQNASYNVGGGDTISDIVNALANVAKGVGSIINAVTPSVRITKKE